jgi:nucleoside-diphosphate-sugar epimerase
MRRDTILIIGARGPIGVGLTRTLRDLHGAARVVAADPGPAADGLFGDGPYERLDVLEKEMLASVVSRYGITQIYLLAGELSAATEKYPAEAWNVGMLGLLNVLELAREKGIGRVFWPSSIAVFGPDAPGWNCPQNAAPNPATVYGISKMIGESWCRYYWNKYAVDVRSVRYPGLIGYEAKPGKGVTDYASEIFHRALEAKSYTCCLQENTVLPMMYMPDAVQAAVELMAAPASALTVRGSYNINAMNFSPRELVLAIQRYVPQLKVVYRPDHRQAIAEGWPLSLNDSVAAADWKWEHAYGICETVRDMLVHLSAGMDVKPGNLMEKQESIRI